MKVNDLRIGNWVSAKGYGDFEIIALSIFNQGHDLVFKSLEYYPQGANINTIEPIPLTEEWLKKFNWFQQNDADMFVFEDNNYFSVDKNGCLYFECGHTAVSVESVHQLQNLYFALTGNELTLNEIIP